MSDYAIIYFCLGLSFVLICLKLLFGGLKDLIFPICLFYFYFAFGPVINYIFGYSIYFGIPKEYVPEACIIFAVALNTMLIGSLIWPSPKIGQIELRDNKLGALRPIYMFSILYACYAIVVVLLGGGGSKIDKIALAIPGIHYSYLMIQIYLISFYFLVINSTLNKLFYLNTAIYIIYSLVIGERDFIFTFFSIIFHRSLLLPKTSKSSLKLIVSLALLLVLATGIFFIRDSSQNSQGVLASILNQGSLLFVNTFSVKLLHERVDYFMGFTYLNSLFNLLPSWIFKTDFNTLDWFKNNYAAASTSGYGFGLDAEGYINFSYFGVFLTFLMILIIQRKIMKHIASHPFFVYYSVFFSAFTMYSLRNDTLAFLKGNLYGIIFFYLIYRFSWKKEKI
jgi:hypothetical protein